MKVKTAVAIRGSGSTESRFWNDKVYKEATDIVRKKRKTERQNRKNGRKHNRG